MDMDIFDESTETKLSVKKFRPLEIKTSFEVNNFILNKYRHLTTLRQQTFLEITSWEMSNPTSFNKNSNQMLIFSPLLTSTNFVKYLGIGIWPIAKIIKTWGQENYGPWPPLLWSYFLFDCSATLFISYTVQWNFSFVNTSVGKLSVK